MTNNLSFGVGGRPHSTPNLEGFPLSIDFIFRSGILEISTYKKKKKIAILAETVTLKHLLRLAPRIWRQDHYLTYNQD